MKNSSGTNTIVATASTLWPDTIQVRLFDSRDAHDNRVRGQIAKTLRLAGEQAKQPSEKIKYRQAVQKAQQVSDDDLAGAQPQPLHVHDPQAKQAFSDGLAPP